MKHRNYDTYENLDVRGRPSGSKSRVNSAKYWTARNLWNHKTYETVKRRKYNTHYKHLKPNTMNAMKPWILALALYCRSFHFRDFFPGVEKEAGREGGNTQALSDVIILIDQFWYVKIPTWLRGLGE